MAKSQDYFELLTFSQKHFPKTQFENLDLEATNNDYFFDLTFPWIINDSNVVLVGAFYEYFESDLSIARTKYTFNTLNLKIGFNHTFNNRWSGTVILLPKISSDFKEINSNSYQYGSVAFATLKKSSRFNLKFGVYYNGDLFGQYVVPLFGFYYKTLDEKTVFNVLLPGNADLNRKLSDDFYMGLRFNAGERSYQITPDALLENESYLHKRNNELKLYMQARLGKNVIAELLGGYTVGRKYEVYDADDKYDFSFLTFRFGDDLYRLNDLFKDGFVQEFKLIFKVDTNDQ